MAFGKQKEQTSKSMPYIHLIQQLNSFKYSSLITTVQLQTQTTSIKLLHTKTDLVCTVQKKKHTVPIYLSITIPIVAEKIKFTFLSKTKWNVSLIFLLLLSRDLKNVSLIFEKNAMYLALFNGVH